MDDQTAITHLKQGDLDGLESLVEGYQARAVHAAYLICCDRALAEDVAQAAFVKAAERIQQFDETRPFAPWFFRIVVNDALKAAQRQMRILPLEDDPEDAASRLADRAGRAAPEHPGRCPQPAARATGRDHNALFPRPKRSGYVCPVGSPAQHDQVVASGGA
jgi:RNA polymerase sigma factor (sigma-70 family)